MKLVDDDEGYYLSDLKKQLGKQRFEKLAEWLRGQTVFMNRGKVCVYKWDYKLPWANAYGFVPPCGRAKARLLISLHPPRLIGAVSALLE